MTKHIKLSLYQDGSGNNKVNDTSTGNQSNVARIYEYQEADYSFNMSVDKNKIKGEGDIGVVTGEVEGNSNAFNVLVDKINHDDTPVDIKIYSDGVGSQDDGLGDKYLGGGAGLGTDSRVEELVSAVKELCKVNGGDVEIELNAAGFSRGSVAMKILLNRIAEECPEGKIKLNNVLLYEPVAAMGVPPLTENLPGYNLEYPATLVNQDTNITEVYVANEYRNTFNLYNYIEGDVDRVVFPGAHSQGGGGYFLDILSAGPLAYGMNYLSKNQSLSFKTISSEDYIKMRLYNAVIENPYLVQTLITDSRLRSANLLEPGDEAFAFEYPQDYEFDTDITFRNHIRSTNEETENLLAMVCSSNPTVDDIAKIGYWQVPLAKKVPVLSENVERVFSTFLRNIEVLGHSLEASELSEEAFIEAFDSIYSDFREQIAWLRITGEENLEEVSILDHNVEMVDDRLELYLENRRKEEAEAELLREVAIGREHREEELEIISAQNALRNAIKTGDTTSIVSAGLDYLSALDERIDKGNGDEGFLSDSTEAVFDAVSSAIGLGQAIDQGDGWGIADQSVDLIEDIDTCLKNTDNSNGFLDTSSSQLLGIGAAGIGLACAINNGDEWGVAESSADVLVEVNSYYASCAENSTAGVSETDISAYCGDTGIAIGGVASAIGLAANIASFDDVLSSGDVGSITYTTASTINNAINTYNAVAHFAGATPIASIPALGYVGAAVQLAQGDIKGAAISAASTYLMCLGPYGVAAAVVLQIGSMLLSDDSPPEATAYFSLDENGNVVLTVGGDDGMQEMANSVGGQIISVMQSYKDSGGRLLIEGALPTFKVINGEKSEINYGQPGGKITVLVDDLSQVATRMQGALIARDHGEKLDSAVKVASLPGGAINWAKVDAIMSGYGFTKRGDNYVIGETKELYGTAVGTGVFRGGGQMGPEGEQFAAKASDITSLPSKTSPRPSQQMGEIVKIISAKNFFSGFGCELAAMSLILGAGLVGSAEQSFGVVQQVNGETVSLPLDGFSLDTYLASLQTGAYLSDVVESISGQVSFSEFEDENELYQFFEENWSQILQNYLWDEQAKQAYLRQHGELIDYNGLLADGSQAPWWSDDDSEDYFNEELFKADTVSSSEQLAVDQVDLHHYSEDMIDGLEVGAFFTMSEDTVLRFLHSSLMYDPAVTGYQSDASSFEVVSFADVKNGQVWFDSNGDIRFTPTENFVGTASFTYTLKDLDGNFIQKQALIAVQNVNDDPVMNDDHFDLDEGDVFYLDKLLNNDFDTDGDTIVIDHLRGVENGGITLLNGRLAFIPDDGFYGDTSFSYWVRDHSDTYPVMGKATLNFQDVNDGGVAGDDRFLILEDEKLVTTLAKLLQNDVDHDGEVLSFNGLGEAVNGTVELQGDGTILFTPQEDYAGTDCGFSYSIRDESGNVTQGRVSIEVLDQREAPVVISSTMAPINEDEVFTFSPDQVAKFVWDADGDAVHLDSITNLQGGIVGIYDGYLSFMPDENYWGIASFDYCANDSHRGTVSGHLSFEILSVNDAIETGDDLLTVEEDQVVNTTVADLLSNDTDVDGSVFSFMGVGETKNGAVILEADDSITFIPESNYSGDEAGFEYYVSDSEGKITTGWVAVRVSAVNDLPEIVSNTMAGTEDIPLVFDAQTLAQFFRDVDGDNLSAVSVEALSGGDVSQKDGVFTFIPDSDFVGNAQLKITVEDGNGGVLSEVVEINLAEKDDPAFIGVDSFATIEEQSLTLSVAELMQNDSDADGLLSFNGIGQVFNGTVTVGASGEIVFTPDADYFGAEGGFEYKVVDPKGFESVGRVTIEVAGVNDAPIIIDNQLTIIEDEPVIFSEEVIEQFIRDIDGDSISLTAINSVEGGSITQSGCVYTFTPDAEYHGSAYLEYTASDNNGEFVNGVLNISVLAQNDVTDFGDDSFSTDEEEAISLSVAQLLANDIDADGEVSFLRLGDAKNGTVSLDGDGLITFTPDKDYTGNQAGFYYVVEDGQGYESAGWVTVDVQNINDLPVITGNRLRIDEDETVAFTPEEIAQFLFDADGDLYSLDLVANVTGGRMEVKNGVYTFIPDADYYGEASFDYSAVSDSGDSIDGAMQLNIMPVNDLPVVAASSESGVEDNEIILQIDDLLAGADDVEDGSNLRFDGVDSSLNGDVYVNHADNTIHFIPDDNYFGDAGFRYNVSDTEGGIAQGYVAISLTGVNDAPLAEDDEKIVGWSNNRYENVYLASTFLNNDIDVDGDPLSIVSVSGAEFGAVSLDAAGNIHYTAVSDDWVGIDTFTYTISDGQGETSTAKVSLDVKINTSPDVYPEIVYTEEDVISIIKQEDLLANDSDVDGDVMKIIGVDQAEHCTVELLANGDIKFTPELNYNNNYPGQASFRYTVTDGISDPVSTIAFFDIDSVNDAPILVAERIDGAVEDNSFSFQVADIMANDTDVEMASAYEEDFITFAGVFDAAHGLISSDDTGTIFYTPNANFCGVETFKYRVVDSYGAESVIESEIWVEPVNDIPVVEEDVASSPAEDSIWNKYSIRNYLTANDVDVDGDVLSIKNARVVAGHGDVKISGGYLQVKPGFREDCMEVEYTVTDGHGGDVISKLTIPSIREHNFAPVITDTYATTYSSNNKVIFSFLVNDKNGGNNWSANGADMGDIASITAGHLSCSDPNARVVVENGYGHFSFKTTSIALSSAEFYANLTITAVDQGGASSTKFVSIDRISWSGGIHHYPVVLDLDGDGVELLSAENGVSFDWDGISGLERSGWVGGDDGFLVYDYNGDQQVTKADELSLKDYDAEAETDLEGLRAFDSNENGVFDSDDEKWADFGVWQDRNSNGVTDEGEFRGLDAQGITAIRLESDGAVRQLEGNTVYGATTYEREDGTVGEAFDVGLTEEMVEAVLVETVLDGGEISSNPINDHDKPEDKFIEVQHTNDNKPESLSVSDVEGFELTEEEMERQFIQLQSDVAANPSLDFPSEISPLAMDESYVVIDADDETEHAFI